MPSGFADGISRRMVLLKISFVSSSLAVTSSYAKFIDICDATISVEWIEHEIETIVLPVLTSVSVRLVSRSEGSANFADLPVTIEVADVLG